MIKDFNFPNMKSRYNVLPAMFGCYDNVSVIEFTNENRNFFAVWAFAAMHIDHSQFTKYLYHTLVGYKCQSEAQEDISSLKMNDIEPMTYAKFLYEAGTSMLKFNSELYCQMKDKQLLGIQSEHLVMCFTNTFK